jgi:uncharacterized 2Fe-2S/4Fe-4S cluster protein (DUF4445 family)
MRSHKVTFIPEGKQVKAEQGQSLQSVMNAAGIHFDFPCGGRGKCGKCRVKVTAGGNQPKEQERSLLSAEELAEGIRLACLVDVTGDMSVELPAEKNIRHQILLSSLDRSAQVLPHVRKRYLEIDRPTLADNRSDWKRVKEALSSQDEETVGHSLPVLRKLPTELRKNSYQITAIIADQKIRGLEAGNTTDTSLGMAFDIGTTTIVGYLADLYTGRELCVVSALNPQTKYGADVISRISYANRGEGALLELNAAVTDAIDELIGQAAGTAGVAREDIYALAVAGNTCMHHLFLGISPRQVALSPYVTAVSEPVIVDADQLRLKINPAGLVLVLPNIAGFVGADTVAVLLAAELDKSKQIKLVIDIGTNGEIALGNHEKIYICSAAAGPAFEGAQISCGMRGATGAIDHVTFDQELSLSVIGGGSALGVCGSALLDAVAGLLENGMINKKGKLLAPHEITNPAGRKFARYIVEHEGSKAFLLSAGEGSKEILITQKDIRELQLAKGAIAAGIQIVMNKSGLQSEDIEEVLLAGAFGNYLNPHSACSIGLIPPELEDRIKMIGNAAGAGAKLALLSTLEYKRAAELARKVEFVELGSERNFTQIFAHSIYFPREITSAKSRRTKRA